MKRPLDAALVVVAALVASISLTYAFGRDQALYFYVAREWLHGALPYRDVLDHKPPGIYVLHAAAILLFGEHMWSIRMLEILAILGSGMLLATAMLPRGVSPKNGFVGLGALLVAILYIGHQNYWDTAQTEIWYASFGLTAVWCAGRVVGTRRAAFFAGLWCGAALVMKPPAIFFALVAAWLLAKRAREEQAWRSAAASLLVGGAIVPGIVLLYFGMHHRGLWHLRDVVLGANAHYARHESDIRSAWDVLASILSMVSRYQPFSGLFLGGSLACYLVHRRRGDALRAGRYFTPWALVFAGACAVAMQMKFYPLHWTVVVVPLASVGVVFFDDVADLVLARLGSVQRSLLVVSFVLALFALAKPESHYYWNDATFAWKAWTGSLDTLARARHFDFPPVDYRYAESVQIGEWIRVHTRPEDPILVRGFEPQIYAIAQRSYGGRFFWTTFLTNRARAYRRQEWLEQDNDDLRRIRPKYVVTLTQQNEGLDSSAYFASRGYLPEMTLSGLSVMRRADLASAQGEASTTR